MGILDGILAKSEAKLLFLRSHRGILTRVANQLTPKVSVSAVRQVFWGKGGGSRRVKEALEAAIAAELGLSELTHGNNPAGLHF